MKPVISKEAFDEVRILRWRGAQHPTYQTIVKQMEQEGIRPYAYTHGPNARLAVRSHGYSKVMYCVEGALEVVFPDLNQRVVLRPGDRLNIPRGVRYAGVVSVQGVRCVEGETPVGLLS